jgi:hypothetical protein
MTETYESLQANARGPGVQEWLEVDKARSDLAQYYRSLREDDRYAPEYKAQKAWERYEQTRAEVAKLAPEARAKMLKSAESLERMSIPRPEGEPLITEDTDRLLLTAHERSRLESLIDRAQKADKGPFKATPTNILKTEYERGLAEGGPGGGATVRAFVGLARDWGLDINAIVAEQRKPHHHGALEDAQAARMRADMVGRAVPEPPYKRRGVAASAPRRDVGTYAAARGAAFVPRDKPREQQSLFKKRRPSWR